MKKFAFVFSLLLSFITQSQQLDGVFIHEDGDIKTVWIATNGYLSITDYKSNEFIATKGGPVIIKEGIIEISYEYNFKEPELVGQTEQLTLSDKYGKLATKSQELDGLWKISHRKTDGEFKEINHDGSRKTIKILKDGYFQWIALDNEKKEIYGTGGGNYAFTSGVYIEIIQFFSKDNSRVGSVLNFEGKIDKEVWWHHFGKSSKGKEIYEVWRLIQSE